MRISEASPPECRHGTSGWSCPRCGIVWAPHVLRCTCEPQGDDERGREIREG